MASILKSKTAFHVPFCMLYKTLHCKCVVITLNLMLRFSKIKLKTDFTSHFGLLGYFEWKTEFINSTLHPRPQSSMDSYEKREELVSESDIVLSPIQIDNQFPTVSPDDTFDRLSQNQCGNFFNKGVAYNFPYELLHGFQKQDSG